MGGYVYGLRRPAATVGPRAMKANADEALVSATRTHVRRTLLRTTH